MKVADSFGQFSFPVIDATVAHKGSKARPKQGAFGMMQDRGVEPKSSNRAQKAGCPLHLGPSISILLHEKEVGVIGSKELLHVPWSSGVAYTLPSRGC